MLNKVYRRRIEVKCVATLEKTISKAIEIASLEVLKNKELLFQLMEDLSPELIKERLEFERMYTDEIGKLLFSAYGLKDSMRDPVWREIKGILDQELGFKDKKQEWFVKLFYRSFLNDDINEKRQDLLRLLYKIAILKRGIEKAQFAESNGKIMEAIRIYQQYSDGSYYERKAQLRLGQLYESFPKESYAHYLRAAELGDPEAAFCVAYMSEYGEGTSINIGRAVTYYTNAASAGHRGAAHNLGFFYYSGTGVKKDLKRAFDLFYFSAKRGKADSMRNLGVMYENGDYVKKNLETALSWYSKAVEYGNVEAEQDCQRIRMKKKSSQFR